MVGWGEGRWFGLSFDSFYILPGKEGDCEDGSNRCFLTVPGKSNQQHKSSATKDSLVFTFNKREQAAATKDNHVLLYFTQ